MTQAIFQAQSASLHRTQARRSISHGMFLMAACLLLVCHVVVAFASRGAFSGEELYGRGRALAISNLVSLVYLASNPWLLRQAPLLVELTLVWLFWVACSCLSLLGYGIATAFMGLLEVSYCPMTLVLFYALHRARPDLLHASRRFFLALLLVCTAFFLLVFRHQNASLTTQAASLNDIYYLLLLLPWVALIPGRTVKWILFVLVAIAVMWSMKRTAIIALGIGFLAHHFAEQNNANRQLRWRATLGFTFAIACAFGIFLYVDNQADGFLAQRIESITTDRGSSRLDIYQEVFRLLGESSIPDWGLGHGHDTVRMFNRMQASEYLSAHNDWLEVLFDYGIPGFALYCAFHWLLLRFTFTLLKRHSPYAPAMTLSYALFFVVSLTSHLVLYPSYYAYLTALWGTLVAMNQHASSMQGYLSWKQQPLVPA